jgi:hypothetical protein
MPRVSHELTLASGMDAASNHHTSAVGIVCLPSHLKAVRLGERHTDAVGSLPLMTSVGTECLALPLDDSTAVL